LKTVLDSLRLIVRDLRLSAREAERVARITGAQLFVNRHATECDSLDRRMLGAPGCSDHHEGEPINVFGRLLIGGPLSWEPECRTMVPERLLLAN